MANQQHDRRSGAPSGDDDPLTLAGLESVEKGRDRRAPETIGSPDDLPQDQQVVPLHLRYRLWTLAGAVATLAWLVGAFYLIGEQIAWEDITSLLPHEVGGLVTGVFTPLALMWMVIAFFERGRQLRHDTESLRWHFRRMTYPSDRAETRVGEITDSLRRQAQALTRASEDALARAEAATHWCAGASRN